MGRRTRKLPSVCLDEHMHPRIADAFRPTFRTVEVAQTSRLKGRDEAEFISELYRENAIFVTSDGVFVDDAIEKRLKHAGIILIPEQITVDEKVLFAEIAGEYVRGSCSASPHAFRGFVLYPGHSGLHTIVSRKDTLEFSWDWLSYMMDVSE
jgi:predicted nuclease of predicted toxin-antitoxin system